VVTGTTTGKLVLWDCKNYGSRGGINKKESYNVPQIDLSNQPTKLNRELTRATSKSSGSTRSGTLSSRKSSGKTMRDDEDIQEKQIPSNEQKQQNEKSLLFKIICK
jgi:hypothetical protein